MMAMVTEAEASPQTEEGDKAEASHSTTVAEDVVTRQKTAAGEAMARSQGATGSKQYWYGEWFRFMFKSNCCLSI